MRYKDKPNISLKSTLPEPVRIARYNSQAVQYFGLQIIVKCLKPMENIKFREGK